MRYTGKELKCRSRESLKGNYTVPVLASIGVSVTTSVFVCIVSMMFRGSTTLATVLSQLTTLIFSLILSVFTAGISYMYLNIGRKNSCSIHDIFYMFHRNPDRVIVVCFVLTLINMVCSVPVYMVQGLVERIGTSEEMLRMFPILMGAICLSMVLSLFVTLPFSFSYMLLVDHPEMSAAEALKGSVSLLKGNKWRLCRFYLSFTGMGILVVLSGFAAFIWVEAYMQASMVQFYMELNGELEQAAGFQEQEDRPGLPARLDDRNDYNAEA